jgi:hypothetical protein
MNEMIEAFVNNKLNYCGGGCLGGGGGVEEHMVLCKSQK